MPFIYKAMNMSYLSIKENNTESFTILLCQKKWGLQCKPGLFSQRDRGQVLGCHLAWHHLLRNCNVLKIKKKSRAHSLFFMGSLKCGILTCRRIMNWANIFVYFQTAVELIEFVRFMRLLADGPGPIVVHCRWIYFSLTQQSFSKAEGKMLKNSSRSGVFSKITPVTCGATEY